MDKNFSRDASSFTHMGRGFGGYCLRAMLASCMALAFVMAPHPAWATGSKGQQNASQHRLINHQRIHELKERISDLRARLKDHRQQHHNGGSTSTTSVEALQAKVASLENSVAALLSADTTLLTSLQAAQTQIQTMQAQITALESRPAGGSGGIPDLEKYVSINPNTLNGVQGPHLIFKGVNVHVQSGSGTTVDTTGLGNLIVGYNEAVQNGTGLNRLGSHNLVGGQMNAFSSSGGLVFGSNNTLAGRYAAILGGEQNNATGWYSTVYGGQFNNSISNYALTPAIGGGGN
jgi:hypothetical protein